MIDVIKSGVLKTKAIYSPIVNGGRESGLQGQTEMECLFFSMTGKDEFGNLSSDFTLYANQTNFANPPKNGDCFYISGDKYLVVAPVLNDNNPHIKPFYTFLLAKQFT